MNRSRGTQSRALLAAMALVAALAVPSAARAWWHGGVVFGFAPFPSPVYVPPPVYYPPPAYYAPPPVSDAPAPAGQACYAGPYVCPLDAPAPAGQACYAGPYVCPLDAPAPVGGPCSCPTNDSSRAGGRVG